MKGKWCPVCRMWVRRSHDCQGDDGVTLVTHPDGEVTAEATPETHAQYIEFIARGVEPFPNEPVCSICRRRHPNREPFTHACE